MKWQGLHPEVGGLTAEHLHCIRVGVLGYILAEHVPACICAFCKCVCEP